MLKKEQMENKDYLPTQDQFNTVIENFENALNTFPDAKVNMMQGIIHECGSPMCHGGWYAVATIKEKYNAKGQDILFIDGANLMAEHLGFDNNNQLEDWAMRNSDVWGNIYGAHMFVDALAFTGDYDIRLKGLNDIIEHWKGVKERANHVSLS